MGHVWPSLTGPFPLLISWEMVSFLRLPFACFLAMATIAIAKIETPTMTRAKIGKIDPI
jgi:hypothetical protein